MSSKETFENNLQLFKSRQYLTFTFQSGFSRIYLNYLSSLYKQLIPSNCNPSHQRFRWNIVAIHPREMPEFWEKTSSTSKKKKKNIEENQPAKKFQRKKINRTRKKIRKRRESRWIVHFRSCSRANVNFELPAAGSNLFREHVVSQGLSPSGYSLSSFCGPDFPEAGLRRGLPFVSVNRGRVSQREREREHVRDTRSKGEKDKNTQRARDRQKEKERKRNTWNTE